MAVTPTTLLVEGSFPELAEELALYIDSLNNEQTSKVASDIEPLLSQIREAEAQEEPNVAAIQKHKDEALKQIVTTASVLNKAPEREFTAAYNLVIYLSNQSPMRDQFLARLCQYLSDQPVNPSTVYGPSLALSSLTTIFNTLPLASESRYHVFLAILKVIQSTPSAQAFEAVVPQLDENVPHWLSIWQLDDEDARKLHVTIADVASLHGDHDLSYKYLLKAIQTVPASSSSEKDSLSLAKRTLVAALTNTSVTDFTPLTTSDAIQGLRKSDSNLFELLEIFSSDDYSAYTDFLETNTLEAAGVPASSADTLSAKIRLLTLAGIAASTPSRSVPYATIASALQIPREEVEMWVIDCIRAGLVEGKLSQLKQEFLVQRATYRVFGEKQWAEIQGRLMVWRRSLESVLSVVKTERERFLREGVNGPEEKINGFERRGGGGGGGGGRRNQQRDQGQQREVDYVGGD